MTDLVQIHVILDSSYYRGLQAGLKPVGVTLPPEPLKKFMKWADDQPFKYTKPEGEGPIFSTTYRGMPVIEGPFIGITFTTEIS